MPVAGLRLAFRTQAAGVVAAIVLLSPFAAAAEQRPHVDAHALLELRDLDGLSLSPDGRWAVVQQRQADAASNAYRQTWFAVSTETGRRHVIDDGGEAMIRTRAAPLIAHGLVIAHAPTWSLDGRWIYYLKRRDGHTQLWRARASGGRAEQLTRNASDVDRVVLSSDGERLLFSVRMTETQLADSLRAEGLEGYRLDETYRFVHGIPRAPAGASLHPFATSSGDIWAYDLRRRRERLATAEEASEFQRRTDAAGTSSVRRARTIASGYVAEARVEARNPEEQGMRPPRTLVVQRDRDREPHVCAAEACTSADMLGVWWRNDDEVVFMVGGRDHRIRLYAWNTQTREHVREIPWSPAGVLFDRDQCDVTNDRLICLYEEPAYPRRLVAVDLQTGALNILFDPNPEWSGFDLGSPPRQLTFRLLGGYETSGYLVLPPDYEPGRRLPLIFVTYTCGGFIRGGTGDEYPAFAFAAEGFAVLCYNLAPIDRELLAREGLRDSERAERGEGDPLSRRVQLGLDTAVADLVEMGVADPERIGITGLSFGAQAVKYALFNMPSLTAAIASSTPIEPSTSFLAIRIGRQQMASWGLGSPTSERWEQLSLARNAHSVRAPFLVNVADSERLVALEPVSALEDAGRAVEMYIYPEEYHIKHQPAHRLAVYRRNIDWMNFWLRGVEDVDPRKADQYERWRRMRDQHCAVIGNTSPPWFCGPMREAR